MTCRRLFIYGSGNVRITSALQMDENGRERVAAMIRFHSPWFAFIRSCLAFSREFFLLLYGWSLFASVAMTGISQLISNQVSAQAT